MRTMKPPPAAEKTLATVEVTTAARLATVPVERIGEWIASGAVLAERIRSKLYISLDDIELLASEMKGI